MYEAIRICCQIRVQEYHAAHKKIGCLYKVEVTLFGFFGGAGISRPRKVQLDLPEEMIIVVVNPMRSAIY